MAEHRIDIEGHIFPWLGDVPAFVEMPGVDGIIFLPIFSTMEKLVEAAVAFGLLFDTIKTIDDPADFLMTMPRQFMGQEVTLIMDVRKKGDDESAYQMVMWPEQSEETDELE